LVRSEFNQGVIDSHLRLLEASPSILLYCSHRPLRPF
jgi:hypothetical protein